MSMPLWKRLWRDEDGQDFVEYALLLAFVSLTTAALIYGPANSINFIWTTENNQLSAAASTLTSR